IRPRERPGNRSSQRPSTKLKSSSRPLAVDAEPVTAWGGPNVTLTIILACMREPCGWRSFVLLNPQCKQIKPRLPRSRRKQGGLENQSDRAHARRSRELVTPTGGVTEDASHLKSITYRGLGEATVTVSYQHCGPVQAAFATGR